MELLKNMETTRNLIYAFAIIFGLSVLVKMSGGTLEDGVGIFLIGINILVAAQLLVFLYQINRTGSLDLD